MLPRWRTEKFHAYVSSKLVDVSAGRIKRLILSVPPRHGKSTLASHIYPAWHLGNFPSQRIILCGYEAQFAASWGRKARDVLEEYGPALFGVSVSPASSSASAWDTAITGADGKLRAIGGGMATAGVGGPILGKGAHVFIVDDPIKNADEARSQTKRASQKDWFRSTAFTRLEADPEGAMIIIMQRWHEDDLVGWQLAEALDDEEDGEQWEVIEFPAIATEHDALGRKPGEALSARYPVERLERVKRKLGSYWFTALYQQKPAPPSGTVFKQSWMTYASQTAGDGGEVLPRAFDYIVQVWDTAFKEGELNDYSACATVAYSKLTRKAYLLDIYREKLEMPGLIKSVKAQAIRWRPNLILVEDKGSGTSAVQTLRSQTKLPVQAQPVRGDKVARAHTVTPFIEDGRFVICKFAMLADFEGELFSFPLGLHDDMVDAVVYALQRIFGAAFREAKQHQG